jgi:5-deoxy-glucuronate isomerase
MSFFVHRVQPGDVFRVKTVGEEAVFVLLGGTCTADWGQGAKLLGKRRDVFDGFPYALYLPAGNEVSFIAQSLCEIAECRSPSEARFEAKLITPGEAVSSLRGGGNASRQILDIMGPEFPADKLTVIEVYTSGGNLWQASESLRFANETLFEDRDIRNRRLLARKPQREAAGLANAKFGLQFFDDGGAAIP